MFNKISKTDLFYVIAFIGSLAFMYFSLIITG